MLFHRLRWKETKDTHSDIVSSSRIVLLSMSLVLYLKKRKKVHHQLQKTGKGTCPIVTYTMKLESFIYVLNAFFVSHVAGWLGAEVVRT